MRIALTGLLSLAVLFGSLAHAADIAAGKEKAELCAGCHGDRGQSTGGAPRIMGPGALPELPSERNYSTDPTSGDPQAIRLKAQTRHAGAPWRDPFRTAQDVFKYVSKEMPLPEKKAGSLKPEEYWAIINFMLSAHGVQLPAEGVTPANAASLKL